MNAKLTTDQDDVAINGDLTRYRALLKISGTVGAQPTVDAVLHSLATLLSNVVSFENIALLLFDPSSQRWTACLRAQSRRCGYRGRYRNHVRGHGARTRA